MRWAMTPNDVDQFVRMFKDMHYALVLIVVELAIIALILIANAL